MFRQHMRGDSFGIKAPGQPPSGGLPEAPGSPTALEGTAGWERKCGVSLSLCELNQMSANWIFSETLDFWVKLSQDI